MLHATCYRGVSGTIMRCHLCRKESNLKNSHIIPEFLFAALYDEKHRFHELHLDTGNKYKQKGFREPLLCGDCEQLLSRYERYASKVLNGGMPLTYRRDGRIIRIGGIDYTHFKLFALSILWRAGVSKMEMFSGVTLGPHEEKLRLMILAEDAGDAGRYPFIVSPIMHEGDVVEALVVPPTQTRLGHQLAYRFVFGGLTWTYVVCNQPSPKEIADAALSKEGTMTMIPWALNDMRFITSMAQELVKNGVL